MILQNLKHVQADAAAISVGTGAVTGDAVDTNGFEEAAFILHVYATTGNLSVCKIQGSADGSTGWTDITGAAFTDGDIAAGDDNKNYAVFLDLRNINYRYLRFTATEDGTGTVAGAMFTLLAQPNEAPMTDAARGLDTSLTV